APAARDIDHNHTRGQGDAEAEQDRARQLESEQKPDGGRGEPGDDRLQGRHPEQVPALASQLGEIELDANFEEEEYDPDVGKDLQLMAVGDKAWCEGGNDQPGRQVSEHRRQTGTPSTPAGERGNQQDKTDLEDG